MVTNEEIDNYITKIPPLPESLKASISAINSGDLTKSALAANEDPALKKFLIVLVNKPIYGFKDRVTDIRQIFGILGVSGAKIVLYKYMISLLSPSSWVLFSLSGKTFQDLQSYLSVEWQKILKHKNIDDKEIESAITLLPASILVCEALFKEHIDEVKLLKESSNIDYSTILKRLCGMDLFDICVKIATYWEMSESIKDVVLASSGAREIKDEKVKELGALMHLLLFYKLSQSTCIEAGLNDFILFNVEFVQDVYEEFMEIMEPAE
ncbi:MAG: HDOD domain-containing protein [Campylobacterota bacterium]|nr:HDOD domain-containing protein [Campylobacterota bacterium]